MTCMGRRQLHVQHLNEQEIKSINKNVLFQLQLQIYYHHTHKHFSHTQMFFHTQTFFTQTHTHTHAHIHNTALHSKCHGLGMVSAIL